MTKWCLGAGQDLGLPGHYPASASLRARVGRVCAVLRTAKADSMKQADPLRTARSALVHRHRVKAELARDLQAQQLIALLVGGTLATADRRVRGEREWRGSETDAGRCETLVKGVERLHVLVAEHV